MKLMRYVTVCLKRKPMGQKQLSCRDGAISVDVQDVSVGDGEAQIFFVTG